jgi:hypothetical protein
LEERIDKYIGKNRISREKIYLKWRKIGRKQRKKVEKKLCFPSSCGKNLNLFNI